MEENLNSTNQAVSPQIVVAPTPVETSTPPEEKPPFGSWWKVGILGLGATILAVTIFFTGYQYSQKQPKPTSYPTISLTPTPTLPPQAITTPTPDETANWKTFLSSRCNFSIKIPPEWNAKNTELLPGTDNPNYNYGCISILAPNYKTVGETMEGLGLFISRTIPGAKFKSVVINSIDDYIKATENILEPSGRAENVQLKAVAGVSGKYFEFSAFQNTANLVFMKNNFIYNISWLQGYAGVYKDRIDQILSTFKFID